MYAIVTDSCCDLNAALAARYEQFEILPMGYTLSGTTHTDILSEPQAVHAFYERLRAGEMCTTSQVAPGDFVACFTRYAERGEAVLSLQFSSALSGTYGAACMARGIVLENYPNAVIEVVDTLAASAGEGLIVYDALENRARGMSLEDNAAQIRARLQSYAHWFTVDDLNFLKRGGRCSPSAAFFGSMLSIKPVLHVDDRGRLIARAKVRGRHQALRALVQHFGTSQAEADQVIFISHGDCEQDAQFVKDELVRQYGCAPERIVLSLIGPVVGSHSGPGTVALFFRGKDRG